MVSGITHHGRVFSRRYITAQIIMSGGIIRWVTIKHTLTNDLWTCVLSGQRYVFVLPPANGIYTIATPGAMAARTVIYDARHATPLVEEWDGLRRILDELGLPRGDGLLADVLRGVRGGYSSKPNADADPSDEGNIEALIGRVSAEEPEWAKRVADWARHLKTRQIVTPVAKISDMVELDLRMTDPARLGKLADVAANSEKALSKITNHQITSKKPWIIIVMLAMAVGVAGFILYDEYSRGNLDFGIPGLSGFSGGASAPSAASGPCSAAALQSAYPDALSLAVALEMGELVCPDGLPTVFQSMVDGLEPELVEWGVRQAMAPPPPTDTQGSPLGPDILDDLPDLSDLGVDLGAPTP